MELTYGKGVDVSLEMSGYNSSVVNSIEATRAGGDVIWFGIKDGDMTIPQFSRVIVKGLTIHNVIGRQIFQTWQTSQRVLSDTTNGIQEKMWNIIMKEGNGTVIKLSEYTPEMFEEKLKQHPKLVFDMQN
ncbi:MAG: Threonine 3-dehydrogenase [Candidatus Magasanikbacteria bacterium GW2011_GWA2_43_9]|nr:MAG: Threonine 3-dehydrogenase [Candidatus Magasanikbacteria bacterium GW2011_GWA2_43_9]